MASNRKQSGNNGAVKSLKGLGSLLSRSNLPTASAVLMLPNLPVLQVQNTEETKQFEAAVEDRYLKLAENAKALGVALGDENGLKFNLAAINQFEGEVMQVITTVNDDWAQRRMAEGFFSAFIATVPQNFTGLVHLTKVGEGLGIIKRSATAPHKLPVFTGGKCEWTNFLCPRQYAEQMKTLTKVVSDANLARRRGQLEELNEGASSNLLEVLAKGGEAVVYCPPDGKYAGGNVRIKIADGVISVLGAVGGCGKIVGEAAEIGVSIPTDSLKDQRIQLKHRLEEREFKLTLAAHALLRRGWLKATADKASMERLNALRNKATGSVQDLVLTQKSGTYHVYFKTWEYQLGEETLAFKNVNALVERNAAGEIRVVEMFDHVKDLFAGCLEFKAPGERFGNLVQPLGAMLRKLHKIYSAKAEQAAEVAEVVKQEETREWVEGMKKEGSSSVVNP